jgi:hypothetical protein
MTQNEMLTLYVYDTATREVVAEIANDQLMRVALGANLEPVSAERWNELLAEDIAARPEVLCYPPDLDACPDSLGCECKGWCGCHKPGWPAGEACDCKPELDFEDVA